jgi:prevent-host-death family protein
MARHFSRFPSRCFRSAKGQKSAAWPALAALSLLGGSRKSLRATAFRASRGKNAEVGITGDGRTLCVRDGAPKGEEPAKLGFQGRQQPGPGMETFNSCSIYSIDITCAMTEYSTSDLSRKSGDIIAEALRRPVTITQRNKPRLVLLSIEDYRRLTATADTRKAGRLETMPDDLFEGVSEAVTTYEQDGDET